RDSFRFSTRSRSRSPFRSQIKGWLHPADELQAKGRTLGALKCSANDTSDIDNSALEEFGNHRGHCAKPIRFLNSSNELARQRFLILTDPRAREKRLARWARSS